MENVKKYARVVLNIIIPLAALYLVCFLGPKLLRFFLPFVIGWVLAMIANPLVRLLERRVKIVRKHSSMMIVVLVLALIIGALYLIISKLVIETVGLIRDLPVYYEALKLEMGATMARLGHLLDFLPQGMQTSLQQFTNNIGEYLSFAVQKIASPTVTVAGNVAKGIPGVLVSSIITIFSSYLFIAERDKIIDFWKSHMPQGGSRYFNYLKKDVRHLIGGYFLAQFKIMFVVAAILAVGFLVLGVNYSLLLAVLISLLDFLPVFGTGTVLVPWALFKLLSGDYVMAVGMVLLYVLTQVIRQLIQPKIVGDTMGLPPLFTLLFLYLGFKISGLAGMILAVPIGMVFLNLYHYGAFDSLITNVKTLVHDIDEFRKKE